MTPMRALAARSGKVRLAGGEASHNFHMARQLIDYGKVAFIQIDCGRIGGLGPGQARRRLCGRPAASPTSTTPSPRTWRSARRSSPMPASKDHVICEYPFAPKAVAWDMSATHLAPDGNGEVVLPSAPGLGIEMNPAGMARYLVDVEISAKGKLLYRTPAL